MPYHGDVLDAYQAQWAQDRKALEDQAFAALQALADARTEVERLQAERKALRCALTAFEMTDEEAVRAALIILREDA